MNTVIMITIISVEAVNITDRFVSGNHADLFLFVLKIICLCILAISELMFERNCGAVLRDAIAVYLL